MLAAYTVVSRDENGDTYERVWYAESAEHAIEQHNDAQLDEDAVCAYMGHSVCGADQ